MPPPAPPPRIADSLAPPRPNSLRRRPFIFVDDPRPVSAGVAVAVAQSVMDHHSPPPADGGMDMGHMNRCSMNMLWNWDTKGQCIVFKSFYVGSASQLFLWMTLLCLLSIAYEYLRLYSCQMDRRLRSPLVLGSTANTTSLSSSETTATVSNLVTSSGTSDGSGRVMKPWGTILVARSDQITRSLLYTVNVAVSFFLMLVVMTYNAQIISAVLIGAFIGHFLFHRELSLLVDEGKGMACH